MKKNFRIISVIAALVMVMGMASTTFAAEENKTLVVGENEAYTTIQAAIDYVDAQEDGTGWTIEVKNGTYERFTVPHYNTSGIADLTITGESEEGVVINVLNDSDIPKEELLVDNGGINIYGKDVTLKNMTIKSGNVKESWAFAAISTNHGKSGGNNVSLTVENCTLTGPEGDNGAQYGIFWACERVEVKDCVISGFANAIEFMCDGFAIPENETFYMTGNTISDCSFAIHGYMGGSNGGGVLDISNNNISGTEALRAKVIVQSNRTAPVSVAANVHDNILNNTIVGYVNLQEEGAANDPLAENTFTGSSHFVEAIEPGTIEFYSTYKAPEGSNGYWALTDLENLEVDWGKNPEGTLEYVQAAIDKANAEGSKTLSITGISENELIKTFTWFKDAIYWVEVEEPDTPTDPADPTDPTVPTTPGENGTPATGDDFNMAPWCAAAVIAALVAVAAATVRRQHQ